MPVIIENIVNNTTNNVTHVVQRKETLYAISKKYNIAIHDLIALNPELKDGLKAGSTIIIQGKPNTSQQHFTNLLLSAQSGTVVV